MKTSQRWVDGDHAPTERELLTGLGGAAARWRELQAYLAASYAIAPETVFYGKKYGWAIRYRKSGRALCTLGPETGAFTVQIVLGQTEATVALAQQRELSANVRRVLFEAKPLHDGRWLWIQPRSAADMKSIKRLLSIKRRPRPAKGDQP